MSERQQQSFGFDSGFPFQHRSLDARFSQFYEISTQLIRIILKIENESTLFADVCRILVQNGIAKMAWVSLIDVADQKVITAASFGEGAGILEEESITLTADALSENSVASIAIREQRPIWCHDFMNDPLSTAWRKQAVRYGWESVSVLPLSREGAVIGMLSMFTGDKDVFNQLLRELLLEVVFVISYALDNLASKENNKGIARRQHLALSRAVMQCPVSIVIADIHGNIEYVNPKFEQVTGYSSAELIGQNPKILSSGEKSAEEYRQMWATILSGKVWRGEFHNRRKDGTLFWEQASISSIMEESGKICGFVAVKEDITEHKAILEKVQQMAFFDPLTHLPNRRLFLDRLQQALANSKRRSQSNALLFIDLDNFKTLNDTKGHHSGDLLLQQAAQRISTCVRESDTVARVGGDEFVVILEGLAGNANEAEIQAKSVGEKILSILNQPYVLTGHYFHNTASIGITMFSDHNDSVDELQMRADIAMYEAKATGRNAIRFFDPQVQAMINTRTNLEVEMRNGILEGQFLLHYQPQVDFNGRIIGVEALLRWQHPTRGMLYPNEFINLAESSGMILSLGSMVLETACRQLNVWASQEKTRHLYLAVNISSTQLLNPNFVDQFLPLLDHNDFDPANFKLELTENLLINDVENIIENMNRVRAKGVYFSLDDFGTGHSSLSHVKTLPINQLKIDQTFVRNLPTNIKDTAITIAILTLARHMGLEVIAEGVESEEQRAFLFANGCHGFQGYLFSKPIPLVALEQLIDTMP